MRNNIEYRKLTEVADINPSYNLTKNSKNHFIEMSAIDETSGKISYFINKTSENSGLSRFKENDILFARITPCTENGKVAIARGLEDEVGLGSTEFIVISPKKVLADWLYFLLKTPEIRDSAVKSMTGTTGRQRVPKEFFETLFIQVPSLEVQRRIASNLLKVNQIHERNIHAIQLSDSYSSSLFHLTFAKEIKTRLIKDCIVKPKCKIVKIPKNKFSESGKYPIVDQGKSLIGGYTDSEESLYNGDLPVILFGDHTLCLKYIDFKFALGADGVKVLTPSKEFDPKYFYYALREVGIESRGYSRHYRYLLEEQIKVPSMELQKEFSQKMSYFEKIRETQIVTSDKLNLLLESLSNKYFNPAN